MTGHEPCEFLPWDSQFFGHRIGRVTARHLEEATLAEIESWRRAHAAECLYFLADSGDAASSQRAENWGFRLVDVRVTYETTNFAARADGRGYPDWSIRPYRPSDLAALRAIARVSHGDTRFYADSRFPRPLCDALYETWITRGCEEALADRVLVAEKAGAPVGYVTCSMDKNARIGKIGLFGVAPEGRGAGIGSGLVREALSWFGERGAERVHVVTQGRNIAAQRLYQRQGFLVHSLELWFHKWFEDPSGKASA